MISISSIEISPDSNDKSAVAIVQTRETANLCIIVVMSYLEMGAKKYPHLYISADIDDGNIEQSWDLRTCPSSCKQALASLLLSVGFKTGILEPLIHKIAEVRTQQAKPK
jgi:hypothetical protein